MKKVQAGEVLGCTAITLVVAASVYIAVAMLATSSDGLSGGNFAAAISSSGEDGTISLRNDGTIDTGELEKSAGERENSTKGGSSGPVDPVKLQALLPKTIGDYKRVSVKTIGASLGGTRAEGIYKNRNKRFTLSIHDQAIMGVITSLGVAFGAEENKETADGYDRTTGKGGTRVHERWSKNRQ